MLLAENEQNLQSMLTCMNEWCKNWCLNVNIAKSNVMHFRSPRKQISGFKFTYGDQDIGLIKTYKYLGIMLDEYMKFDVCSTLLSESAGRALGGIVAKFKDLKNSGFETFTKLYESGVCSISDYCGEIWGYKEFYCSKQLHLRAMRYYLGVHRYAAIPAIEGDMGWLNPRYRRFLKIAQFWNRMIKMDDSRLTKLLFNIDYNICKNNWSSDVREMFELIGQIDVFASKICCDVDNVKAKLFQEMENNWCDSIEHKPKLRTYKKYKHNINVEPYVSHYMSRGNRSILAQFRFGILPLRIETGRFDSTPLEDRLCIFCNMNVIEDEFHFLIQCPMYIIPRQTLFHNISLNEDSFLRLNQSEKFNFINQNCQKQLAIYLCKSWEIRKSLMYNNVDSV